MPPELAPKVLSAGGPRRRVCQLTEPVRKQLGAEKAGEAGGSAGGVKRAPAPAKKSAKKQPKKRGKQPARFDQIVEDSDSDAEPEECAEITTLELLG